MFLKTLCPCMRLAASPSIFKISPYFQTWFLVEIAAKGWLIILNQFGGVCRRPIDIGPGTSSSSTPNILTAQLSPVFHSALVRENTKGKILSLGNQCIVSIYHRKGIAFPIVRWMWASANQFFHSGSSEKAALLGLRLMPTPSKYMVIKSMH